MNKRFLPALFLAISLTGCGTTNDAVVTVPQTPVSTAPTVAASNIIAVAKVKDPGTALRLAPRDHLDGGRGTVRKETATAAAANLTVAQLELSYDTIFGSLSTNLGVTNSTSQVQGDITFIASQPGTGFFNLTKAPIQNNPLNVTSVNYQPVTYNTTVALPAGNQTFQVSGGLCMPQGITASQVKGVVVFFHGTTTSKAEVPSQYANSSEFQLATEVFASQGYIVVGPDYVGQGIDFADAHPYVIYPQVSVQAGLDLLNAVQPLIAAQYPGIGTQKLFSAGYSEGGAYAVWFNSVVSAGSNLNSFYKFTHAIGMEGAYSTSNVTSGFLFGNVGAGSGNPYNIQDVLITNLAKAVLAADALLSYTTYTLGGNSAAVFNTDFFQMKASGSVNQSDCNVNGQNVNIAQAFNQAAIDIAKPVLYSALDKSANGASYPGEFTILFSSSNSINSLVSSTLIGSGMSQLQAALTAADVNLSSVANGSVSILSLDQDSIVSPNNFAWLQTNYPTKIKNAITIPHNSLQAVSPLSTSKPATWEAIDHTSALPYEFLYALNILNSF